MKTLPSPCSTKPTWLLCGLFQAEDAFAQDWLQLAAALAAPLLSRLREQRHQQQLDRLLGLLELTQATLA